MAKVSSHLWFERDARAAVDFYVSTIPGSSVTAAVPIPAETPSGPAGSVLVIPFRLCNQDFIALEAGPLDPFNHSFSIMVECASQDELDRIWNAFLDNGGTAEQCGWLRDRWGLCWQIAPAALSQMIAGPDRDAAKRVTGAMLKMVKFDIATLEKAFKG